MRNGWIAIALSIGFCGCYEVLSPRPMGELDVKLIPEEWDGVWFVSDSDFVVFKVADPETSSLQASFLERDETGSPVLEHTSFFVRESGDWLFISMPNVNEEHTEPVEYHWGRAKKDGDTLLVWLPDHDKFEKLVNEGVLPGETASTDVKLGELDSSHYAILTSEERGVLFDWDEPIILRRIRE